VDHRTAETLLQRAVAGLEVTDGELTEALVHARTCAVCGPRFELGRAQASSERKDMAEVPVEPTALFARALTAALSAPEAVARIRAAGRLGSFQQLGPAALAALVKAAAEDPEESVRAAALAALDELDDEVSLPQRVIDAWSATPAEAAPYLADCLSRLADPEAPTVARVARLVTEETEAGDEFAVQGESGATGRIVREEGELWLRLNRLPGNFEKTKPIVAVPTALGKRAPEIEWSGETPGLVRAREPVAEGSLDVHLGNVLPRSPFSSKLFERLYLLDPRSRRGDS
jgi:hypothetical protein